MNVPKGNFCKNVLNDTVMNFYLKQQQMGPSCEDDKQTYKIDVSQADYLIIIPNLLNKMPDPIAKKDDPRVYS